MELRLPHVPPLWRETLIGFEAAGLLRSPVWRGDGCERADGDGVLLIPGFMAGDGSLGLMTRWLRGLGYRTKSAGIRSNVGCSEAVCSALEPRLECLAEATGRRVAIVGQSRGGMLGKVLAIRRPDLVSGVVTLGSPLRSQLAVHPLVLGQIGIVGTLGAVGLSGVFGHNCLRGTCCEEFRRAAQAEFPADVSLVSLYSRTDGIVDWRACLDPAADELVEVHASHCGMSVNAEAYRAVANSLTRFREGDAWPGAWFANAA